MALAFTGIQVGELQLGHRIVLAPLTRFRATKGTHVPQAMSEIYYEQRASGGGLLITEATYIAADAGGSLRVPGIFNHDQIVAWKKITDRVHKKGGYIFCQLWHQGRASNSSASGKAIVSSSDVPIQGNTQDAHGNIVPHETPRSLTSTEIKDMIQTYKVASLNAIQAGFDGVEIHSANGYLPNQFLEDGVNKRTDEYGGPIGNRARFVLEIVDEITKAIGEKKVGIRFSPWGTFNDMSDSDPLHTYSYTIQQLQERNPNLAYIHLIEPLIAGNSTLEDDGHLSKKSLIHFRHIWKGVLITAGGYVTTQSLDKIENRETDLMAFGKVFIANPDLPKRLQHNLPLHPYDRSTFYTFDEKGYIDYPFFDERNLQN